MIPAMTQPVNWVDLLLSLATLLGFVVTFVVSLVKVNSDLTLERLRKFTAPFSGAEFTPDPAHVELLKTDRDYRYRIRESLVLVGLAAGCLIVGAILFGNTDPGDVGMRSLALYVASCGCGLEWWATVIATRLVMNKFTETVQTLFFLYFSGAMLLAVAVSVVVAVRLAQVTH